MDVRVRLVFADDVGRHVQRRRGFSSCWYLVPKDAKLVGDWTHMLLREFELRKSCPKGLELHLEDLPVLATQSIRIVRDNDTIVVQCPSIEGEEADNDETSSSENKLENFKLRKRKARGNKEEPCKKKIKTTQDGLKRLTERQKSEAKSRGKSIAKTLVEPKKSSSSSSSDSSSSSSNSSESSSESEDESAAQRNRKRVVQVATTNKQLPDKDAATTCRKTFVSNGVANKTNATSGKSGKEPRRRRRRLRQRNGGRQRNGNQASIADSSASVAPLSVNKNTASEAQEQVATQLPKQTSSAKRQNVSGIAGVRGKARAKRHVLFDEETGDQVEVEHDEHRCDVRENVQTSERSPAPELAKYGPSSSSNQRSRIVRDNQGGLVSSSRLVNGDEGANVYNNAPKREEKSKYVERWKRPYKIVATVLDKKSEKLASSTADLTKLLGSYPTAPATSFHFVVKDVVAFKTLTLCLETWQPVLSEWQCGQVRSMDASRNAIELSNWILAANGDSIDFREAPHTDQQSVQTSEISELRFLSGPSYSSLQQADEQDAR